MGVDDEHLLRMLREVEDVEEAVAAAPDLDAQDEPNFDPCLYCGEPAQYTAECAICGEAGCLPKDLWSPGDVDPCLGLCVRCARNIHIGCALEDEAGNIRCERCHI